MLRAQIVRFLKINTDPLKVCPLAVDPRNSPKTMGENLPIPPKPGGGDGSTLLWCVMGRKNSFKTNILKGVTAGVNLFEVGKVLYLREFR